MLCLYVIDVRHFSNGCHINCLETIDWLPEKYSFHNCRNPGCELMKFFWHWVFHDAEVSILVPFVGNYISFILFFSIKVWGEERNVRRTYEDKYFVCKYFIFKLSQILWSWREKELNFKFIWNSLFQMLWLEQFQLPLRCSYAWHFHILRINILLFNLYFIFALQMPSRQIPFHMNICTNLFVWFNRILKLINVYPSLQIWRVLDTSFFSFH